MDTKFVLVCRQLFDRLVEVMFPLLDPSGQNNLTLVVKLVVDFGDVRTNWDRYVNTEIEYSDSSGDKLGQYQTKTLNWIIRARAAGAPVALYKTDVQRAEQLVRILKNGD